MTINSSANVGIGTTSPGTKLDVSGIARATSLSTVSGLGLQVGGYAFLSQTTSGVMTFLGHNIRASDSVANTAIVQNAGWISSLMKMYYSDGITFHTDSTVYAAGATYPLSTTERMRITPAGNVGIGTTSPNSKIDVRGVIEGGNGTIRTVISYTGSGGVAGTISNHPFILYANNDERMRITSAGDVGIGTTSPSAKLHVIGNATVSSTLATVNAKITGTLTDRLNLPGTAGQVLSSTATGIEWVAAGGGGGGSTIIVKDEGVSIGSSFTTLNFAGNNIQATASGVTANITAFNNAGTGSYYLNAATTNYAPGATFGDVEIDSALIFASSPDAASGSSKLIATLTFGVENVSSYEGFNNFEFRLYDVSQSIVVSDTTHIWTGYMSKDEGATRTVFTFHIPLETDVTPGDEIRVQAKQGVSYTPEIYFCAITLLEGTT
jgi:hypothetical protein